jgi:hypothetical protein
VKVDDKLKRIKDLKEQKVKISDEIAKLGEELAAEMKAVLSSGKPRKQRAQPARGGANGSA